MTDWPADRGIEPPGPISVQMRGEPIAAQTRKIFAQWGDVQAVEVQPGQLLLTMRDGRMVTLVQLLDDWIEHP